jgi:hypothetical protein
MSNQAASRNRGVARQTGTVLLSIVKWVAAIATILLFGIGVPLLWIWVGSQLQGGTAPSLSGIGVALLGIVASYVLLAFVLAWIKARTNPVEGPIRHDWNRSLSAERRQVTQTHPIEDIVIAATILVGVIATGWFLVAGDPGTPVGY